MLCTFCGTDNSPENKFCGMCGVRLERRKIERRVRHGAASLKCASCGHVCEPGTTFCGMCGARIERRLSERRVSEERATAIANVQLPSPEVPDMPEVPEKKGPESKPGLGATPEPPPEPELPAAPPAAEVSPRPPAAIFRSNGPAERPAPADRRTISGPSFLGLSEPSGDGGEYLLEEEKSSGTMVRTLVFLMILAVAVGLGYMQWRSSLRASQKAPEPPKAASAAPSAEEQKATPETSPTPEAANAPGAAESTPSPTAASASDKSAEVQPDSPTLAAEKSNPEDTSTRAEKNAAKKEKARQEPPLLKPSAALIRAQDYLQGRNGVKQDCDQGLTYLRAAVQRSEPAAAMQMGELYANGRCVQQDRVMAYRWMNSAREKAPGNAAIQTTVDQLWGRMTPQERKEAGR
jgi:TPR repeat protein